MANLKDIVNTLTILGAGATERPANCPECAATLVYARSGWSNSDHVAYNCDDCDRIVCMSCLLPKPAEGTCAACRNAASPLAEVTS